MIAKIIDISKLPPWDEIKLMPTLDHPSIVKVKKFPILNTVKIIAFQISTLSGFTVLVEETILSTYHSKRQNVKR